MSSSALRELYDRDFFEWTQRAAETLRSLSIPELDTEHVAEEIESMGRRDLSAVFSRLSRILEHKLKLEFVSGQRHEYNRRSWNVSVVKQQVQLRRTLRDSPSLRVRIPDLLPEAYEGARQVFVSEYSVEVPGSCPWTVEELLGPS